MMAVATMLGVWLKRLGRDSEVMLIGVVIAVENKLCKIFSDISEGCVFMN